MCLQIVNGSASQWALPDTNFALGNFTVQWGPDETRNVSKQFVGEFTLKSGGKVRCLLYMSHNTLGMIHAAVTSSSFCFGTRSWRKASDSLFEAFPGLIVHVYHNLVK